MLTYQEKASFLAGNQSDKLSPGYSVNILAQQLAKTLADVSAKIYANPSPKFTGNQSGEYFSGQSAKHFANQLILTTVGVWDNSENLKRGEFTPFTKGDFSHLSKEANYPHWQGLIGVTTQGRIEFLQSIKKERIEFLESIKKGSQSATLGNVDIEYRASENINISLLLWYGKYQLLGSMPRLSSSLRRSRLIQPALLSSPSSIIALVKRSDKSASKRSCTTILSFWFSLVDIGVHPYILNLLNGNVHHCIPLSKAMPRSGGTLTGHLITNDRVIIEVTMSKYNTPVTGRTSLTPNQSYRWLFLALNRSDYTAKPCRIAVTAPNENSARLMFVRDYILSFAGRLPAQEVTA
ncbi:host cell division inhibitor Icd-like protein [Providencia rustigianii]|uniref:host cell division inhibitor Icd-like protein n=1 Tax=Providencia rustigianii TaxID=158850 RepID=UPI002244C05F|nr:host cell division inhibitor Icd-like protein [Providencia rustigianii]